MRAELLSDLLTIARGQSGRKTPATPATPVTAPSWCRPKPLKLQALQALQVKNSSPEKDAFRAETDPETDLAVSIQEAIEERKAFCAGAVPPIYLDTWARLNHQMPLHIADADWYRAVNDGGLFLERWGHEAAQWGWRAGDLFDVPRDGQRGGLIWQAKGERVEALGADHARLADGRTIMRSEENQ